ncbi:hypothetical protein K438DRAFT_1966350 [Mycena galopus ATCC 62051]|nr:hypothetical protein K438DRAFT_1966350 [Mycena galopus ATCC 62051]
MLTVVDSPSERQAAVQSFYQNEEKEEWQTERENTTDTSDELSASSENGSEEIVSPEVFLSQPIQTAPFSLLLGQLWQRGNLVSIDERDEGTYLIFKDRETRTLHYELLAVPYEGPNVTMSATQYQAFTFLKDFDGTQGKMDRWKTYGDIGPSRFVGKDENILWKGQRSKVEPRVSPSFSFAMALSHPITEPMLLRDNNQGPFGPLKEIQYLQRQQTRAPPMPVAALNVTGPIVAVEELVCQQWTDWDQRRPLQVVHWSLATNVLRVFPANKGTGIPYTVACHEFTMHLAAPTSPSEAWRLECPYLSNERLREAVAGMVPLGIDLGFELAFATHATSTVPDMLPLLERLRLSQAKVTPELRCVLDEMRGPLQTEWVAPTALQPHETPVALHEMLERFTNEYGEGPKEREEWNGQKSFREVEEGPPQLSLPHSPATISPTHDRTNEPSHTTLFDPPVFYRRRQVVDRELWSSSSPSHSASSSSNKSYDLVDPVPAPRHTAVHERIPTISPGGWSPAVTEWSVETPDFMFSPTWVIDEAVARVLNATAAEPPATASMGSLTNTTPFLNGDAESGLHMPYHRLPQFTIQPGAPEDVQLALYFWLYDSALKQLGACRFEDEFGSEPAEKALHILHGPLRHFIDYAAMAAKGYKTFKTPPPINSNRCP